MTEVTALDERKYSEYQRRIQSCMKERGFVYVAVDTDFFAERDHYRAMNPLNREVASKFGYHAPPIVSLTDRNEHSIAFDDAINGVGENTGSGCAQPAYVEVDSLTRPVFAAAQALLNSLTEALSGFAVSEEGSVILEAWSGCMAAKGFTAPTQEALAQTYLGLPEPSPEELLVRQFDLECDLETRLTESRSGWEHRRFDQWKAEYAASLTELDGLIDMASIDLSTMEAQQL